MSIFRNDLYRGRRFLLIWTFAICFMLGICILIYPEMTTQMNEISDMFADMGSFSFSTSFTDLCREQSLFLTNGIKNGAHKKRPS